MANKATSPPVRIPGLNLRRSGAFYLSLRTIIVRFDSHFAFPFCAGWGVERFGRRVCGWRTCHAHATIRHQAAIDLVAVGLSAGLTSRSASSPRSLPGPSATSRYNYTDGRYPRKTEFK